MQAAYAIYLDRLAGTRLPPMDADYSLEIRDYPTWVADADNRIVGGLIMVFDQAQASIANIAVHPALQGRGLGGALMQFAEATAAEKGCTTMRLATHVLLAENVAWYLHQGWTEVDRDDVRVHMTKPLPQQPPVEDHR